jgi:REP element-mobilizing transposase RayT
VPPQKTLRKTVRLDPAVYAQPGAVALLTACCTSRRTVFADPDHAEAVTAELGRLHGDTWRILGFCVMPDHIHLLVLNINGSLVDLVRLLKGRIAKQLRGDVAGPVWQRSFHDHLLRRNEDINRTLQYMFENPVRAGLVDQWTDYRWSGSMQWPDIDPEFFSINPKDFLWNEVFRYSTGDTEPE